MVKLPEPENSTKNLIFKHYEEKGNSEKPRPHLGASIVGHKCERFIWLIFRWALKSTFEGRNIKLFDRGRDEELRIIKDLKTVGCDVVSELGGKQIKVDFGCHVSGDLDGIIRSGLLEAPKSQHVLEMKTHNDKSFKQLLKDGVKKSKPEHFVQMQVYMHGTKINRGLYYASSKNDDDIYLERVYYDKDFAEKYIARGKRLALENRLPPPISNDASWYECKMCDYHRFCHQTKTLENVNCRTCAHATPMPDSTWRCERYDSNNIPYEFQLKGCESHVLHPDLVPWEIKDGPDEWTAVYNIDGKNVANGEACANIYSSREILTNPKACANANENLVGEIRTAFPGAEIVSGEDVT